MSFQNQISPAGHSYAQTMAELIKKMPLNCVKLRKLNQLNNQPSAR